MTTEETEKVMSELRQKFREPDYELVPIELRMGLFVLRNPSHAEHMMYKKMILDEAQQAVATHNVFVSTCVYPEREAALKALQRWPGILMNKKVQSAIAYLSGAVDTLEGKA